MTEPTSHDRNRRLGRGLGALIGSATAAQPVQSGERAREIPLELIAANPYQPRREFPEDELNALENSLRTNGLLQPVAVRPRGSGFELIAGERRLRAARRLGWTTITAVVREITDAEHLTLALVENLQREDLNPMDEAEGFRQLAGEFAYSQQQVAEAVGKDRSTVANSLRLLSLPAEVQQMIRSQSLTPGHARALLALPSTVSLVETAQRVVARQMTVRDVERLSSKRRSKQAPARSPRDTAAATRTVEDRLRRYLQTDVRVDANAKLHGEVRIRFYSSDDLDRLAELITGAMEEGP